MHKTFNVSNWFFSHSPKLPTGMVSYWLVGRKVEGDMTTVVSAATDHPDTATNGSSFTFRR
jgi:hypothetical protein